MKLACEDFFIHDIFQFSLNLLTSLFPNSADEDKAFGGNLDRMNTRAIIQYNGHVKWLAPIILKSQCDIDVRYFPFDTQYCPLKFGSWTYNLARLNFYNESSGADLSMIICVPIILSLIRFKILRGRRKKT